MGKGGGVQFDPLHISRRTYLIYQYNFIQLLNNLFKICWKWKNADIICYNLTSLVFFVSSWCQKIQKIDENWWKLANINRECPHIYGTTWGNSMTFSGKTFLKIISKVTKKTRFLPLLKRYSFRKTTGGDQIETPSRFRVDLELSNKPRKLSNIPAIK